VPEPADLYGTGQLVRVVVVRAEERASGTVPEDSIAQGAVHL
jgi:hypothetical protein